jgi:hypothetical protein
VAQRHTTRSTHNTGRACAVARSSPRRRCRLPPGAPPGIGSGGRSGTDRPRRRAAPRRATGQRQHGQAPPRQHALPATHGPGAWRDPQLGAARGNPGHPALPPRARYRLLRPPAHVCPGIGRQAIGHLRHDDRARLPEVGLLRRGRLVPPEPRGGPERSRPPGENTRSGPSLNRLGPSGGARRVRQAETANGVRDADLSARVAERMRPTSHWTTRG